MPRSLLACLAVACAAVAATPAKAGHRSPELWATINICDTEAHPNQLGVRARMPGNGRRDLMIMRFRAQYFTESDGRWRSVSGARSGWMRLGRARVRSRETGFTFRIEPPAAGERFVVRGVVDYRWRRKVRSKRTRRVRWKTVRKERLNTRTRSAPVRGADPPGYSNGVCEIRG